MLTLLYENRDPVITADHPDVIASGNLSGFKTGDSIRGEIPGNDHAGRIWRVKSVITGVEGIAGPYAEETSSSPG